MYTARVSCRVCGTGLKSIISLGTQALPRWLVTPDSIYPSAPLSLAICLNPECCLVQLEHTTDANLLWRDADYGYRSGVTQTMRNALDNVVAGALQKVDMQHSDVVVDIGANDGTLLKAYGEVWETVAYEPTLKFAEEVDMVADYPIHDYFSADAYPTNLPPAKIITACAMFYDLENPLAFLRGVKQLLDDEGVFVMQLSYLPLMLLHNDFLNICHEHLEYYSLHSLEYALELCGLRAFDAEVNEINGGSIRLYIDKGQRSESFMLYALRRWEEALQLGTAEPYDTFNWSVARIREDLQRVVADAAGAGKTVYGYAASTKGSVLLQYCSFGPGEIGGVAERNPEKVGRFLAGSSIPIISEEEMRHALPDYLLVLAWAFMDEFRQREKEWHDHGGLFIVPLPEVSVE